MTIESRELFDLCKQVYEATGWDDTDSIVNSSGDRTFSGYLGQRLYKYFVPLYTSDYLLEEIDRKIGETKILHVYSMFDIDTYERYFKANVGSPGTTEIQTDRTDTSLKALLKLTLKLNIVTGKQIGRAHV